MSSAQDSKKDNRTNEEILSSLRDNIKQFTRQRERIFKSAKLFWNRKPGDPIEGLDPTKNDIGDAADLYITAMRPLSRDILALARRDGRVANLKDQHEHLLGK